jgi:hypothetical protein
MVLVRHPSAKIRVECAPKKRTKPKINQVMPTPCKDRTDILSEFAPKTSAMTGHGL